ncbi:MAG: substrate-binding domain-containing protein, partial [Phycisphaeraceae bacterium]
QTQLYDAHGDVAMDLTMLRQLPESDFAGAVIISLHSKTFNEAIFDLKRQRFPFVLVDQKFHDIEIPAVTADNHDGGLQVGQHLLAHGHERIGFIGDLVAVTVRDRLMGLRDAVADAGKPFDRSLVIDLCEDRDQDRLGDWSGEVEAATRQLMQRDAPPTAIFFSCDAVARAGCRALQAMGFRVPADVSIVGFDDDPLCQWVTPGLTTVRQPFFGMGETAIRMLCELMVNPDARIAPQVLPVTLVARDSVAQALRSS